LAERVEILAARLVEPAVAEIPSGELAEQRRRCLRQRQALLRTLREYFAEQGFCEIEAPSLVRAPGQEPHLLPFETSFAGQGGPQTLYLATSPEYSMKRLLVEGWERIFSLGRSYRNGRDECSPLHQPEFTLLEWYRAFAGLPALAEDLQQLLARTARAMSGGTVVARGDARVDLGLAPSWCTLAEAFSEWVGVSLEPYLDEDDASFLAALPAGYRAGPGGDRERADRAFFHLLLEKIEPHLGQGVATLLWQFPRRHAALARLHADDPRVASRFELYVLGQELANAFDELCDPEEQGRRLREEQEQRLRAGGPRLPICDDFLHSLRRGMPPAAGIALGVDRLHLVLAERGALTEVLPFRGWNHT
jgi:lysyl-tRNA synthetase class 2